MICSLYEEVIIIILVIQFTLFSIFLFILFKRNQKIMCDNITLSKVLDDKIDGLAITINNLSDSILKKNDMYYENSSLQKTLSEIYLLLEKANSTLVKFDNDKLHDSNNNK